MVKCLIRITTRVNVHLRMINHCYRDVKVRVLSLGPRMLGKALGVLPLYPSLMGQQEPSRLSPRLGTPLPCSHASGPAGKVGSNEAFFVLFSCQFFLHIYCDKETHFMQFPVFLGYLVSAVVLKENFC